MKLLIDSNAQAHKVKHTLGELTFETMRVGVIFGFLGQIQKLAKEYGTNDLIFTWDSNKSHRENLFPAYKEKRRTLKEDKTPEEKEIDKAAYAQFDLLYNEVLPEIGFVNNYKLKGYEGDDLIASIVYANSKDDFLIVSGDEDMYQLLDPNVSILNSRGLYTLKDFNKEYDIDSLDWIQVKSIAGCKSDEVPGIRGVKEKTAIKYLKGLLTPNMKGYQSITCPEGRNIIQRNKQLVTLPFHDCPEIILKPQGSLSIDGFMEICKRYGFESYLRKESLDKWKTILNLK